MIGKFLYEVRERNPKYLLPLFGLIVLLFGLSLYTGTPDRFRPVLLLLGCLPMAVLFAANARW